MASVSSKTANNAVAFVNGRVCTMDVKKPWAPAFVVSPTGDFATVGSDDEIRAIVRRDKLVVYDLRQHFVMPGIHDAHTHLLVASMQKLNECDIGFGSNGETLAGNLHRASCACAYTNFPDGVPDSKYLDDRYPDQPVLVRETSCHNVLFNTASLKRCGIDERETQDPPGGYYKRRADGSLTGEIVEGATRDVWLSLPQAPLAYVKRTLEYGIEMCHRFGITSCQEASANTVYLHALKELEGENRLHLSVYPHIVCAPEGPALESEDSLRAVLDIAATFDSKHVRARFVNFFLDGAPLPPDFTQCDLDADGNPDSKFLLLDDDKLFDSLQKYDARGMTCKVHVAGEGSVRRALDIFQTLRNKHPNGPWHELAHCTGSGRLRGRTDGDSRARCGVS
ncbi:uncharacterized protein PV06_04591 [Exophiala oligosperma]|uniref:Amidohydrolase 3 domain-containing protein n=1 Tax=Exophiala oligosperma TaxID=215243 RepID=A0A0D2DKN0_9EURO|nr:uncharacterized protein PV06_04591 [Exophiala oligosperma]KIW43493.1 hypothetical protein PV06_04591 [Exophiala oligosperma]